MSWPEALDWALIRLPILAGSAAILVVGLTAFVLAVSLAVSEHRRDRVRRLGGDPVVEGIILLVVAVLTVFASWRLWSFGLEVLT